jgi:hypothetical protein
MTRPRPILLGYQRVRGIQPARTEHDRLVLYAFAEREGYELASVYTCIPGDRGAFALMIALVQEGAASAVAVPSEADLGETARERRRARELIEGAGVPVLVAQIL